MIFQICFFLLYFIVKNSQSTLILVLYYPSYSLLLILQIHFINATANYFWAMLSVKIKNLQQCYFNFEWYATGNNAKPGDLMYLSLMCLSLFHQGTHNLCKTACWHWVHNNHPHQNCIQLYWLDHRNFHLRPNEEHHILFKKIYIHIYMCKCIHRHIFFCSVNIYLRKGCCSVSFRTSYAHL